MSTDAILFLITFLVWNGLSVSYLTWQSRQGMLTPLKLTLVFTLGFGFLVAGFFLFFVTRAEGFSLKALGFAAVVFLILILCGIPVYFIAKHGLVEHLNQWGTRAGMRKE